MSAYVLGFEEIEKTKLMVVGGKGLNLGELSRVEGIQVPEGFCVTTEAYKRTVQQSKKFTELLNQLSLLMVEDRERIAEISENIRMVIEELGMAKNISEEIIRMHSELGREHAYAVRSSATAEDLPFASFAGQQDTYLNIIGSEALLEHIRKCWASLFTERAVIYRMQNGFDHSKVFLSVVIQRMVFPEASGIMFTADPVTFNRKVLSIDASFGLGETLVSGLVNPDNYKVRAGKIVEKTISTKKVAIYALTEGGTQEQEIEPNRQNKQTLTDEQIIQLEELGRKLEAYFSSPQDIEWCLFENTLYIVQSRPITTLFPMLDLNDGENRVYMSVGHQQMMTEAMKPLGISFFSFLSNSELNTAGGRLFFDLSHDLASPIGRKLILTTMGKNDPLVHNVISSLMERKDFIKALPKGKRMLTLGSEELTWSLPVKAIQAYRKNDIAIVQQLISESQESLKEVEQTIESFSGEELFDFIEQDHKQLKELLYDQQSLGVIMVGVYAVNWLNKKMEKWLGDKNAADTLSQSVPYNVTSEMGLALLDVSDVVRQYPAVISYFEEEKDEAFFKGLVKVEGGGTVADSLRTYLEKYGMRCTGEIDITRTRWSEQPTTLIPMILSNIKNFEPNARSKKFEQGRREAEEKAQDLLTRLEPLPGGKQKAKKTQKMISVLRNFIGYREYPKYSFISRYYIYKKALLKEATVLVQKGIISEKEDIYYLSFEELREVVRTNQLDYRMITERKEKYEFYEKLTPPRAMTSEGEVLFGQYNTDNIPEGALAGIPVSTGIIEGRARVVLKMEDANIEEGDILVTAFTDPSWTPLFVSVKGLVTEVGGLMTHGAVIAREYGLPAVVGVENATKLIKDGQRIRVNGSEGYVEIV
ncbi:phosphoenolpyruvate synthase [Rossellomorea sp. BNER]|uniref:phosphoenolpyruvate synthase n=1 Tax=Rossellomorea sp. BNER TaxID=2962031 RepID=UPI003AF2BD84|nr:phosphoenolpyruvate synthase [Rossellomorea sp. BNER]